MASLHLQASTSLSRAPRPPSPFPLDRTKWRVGGNALLDVKETLQDTKESRCTVAPAPAPVSARGREAERRCPAHDEGTTTATARRSRCRRRRRHRRWRVIESTHGRGKRSCSGRVRVRVRGRGKDARPGEHPCFLWRETEVRVAAPNSAATAAAATLLVGNRDCCRGRCRCCFGTGPGVAAFPLGRRRASRRGRHLLGLRRWGCGVGVVAVPKFHGRGNRKNVCHVHKSDRKAHAGGRGAEGREGRNGGPSYFCYALRHLTTGHACIGTPARNMP